MFNVLKSRARKSLSEIREIKKLQKYRSCKELAPYRENKDLIHMRSISAPLKINKEKVKDIEYLEKSLTKDLTK
jgi:hypothetical protein